MHQILAQYIVCGLYPSQGVFFTLRQADKAAFTGNVSAYKLPYPQACISAKTHILAVIVFSGGVKKPDVSFLNYVHFGNTGYIEHSRYFYHQTKV